MTKSERDPRLLCQRLTTEQRQYLRRSFRVRRFTSLAALAAPFVLALVQTASPNTVKAILGEWAPIAVFTALTLGVIIIAVIYRCPLCGGRPMSVWDMDPTRSILGRPSFGMDLSPKICKSCGLDL